MGSDDGGGGLSPSPSPSRPPLAPFPLLADPRSYRANTFDYMAGWVAPAGAGAASHSGPATAAAAPSSQQGQGHEGDAAPPVGAAAAVTYRQWVEVFRKSIPTYRAHAARDQGPGACGGGDGMTDEERQAAAARFAADFGAALDGLDADPQAMVDGRAEGEPFGCVFLCALRERLLHRAGFRDVFWRVKQQENAAALALLPALLVELNAERDARSRLELALRGVFAGNIFDLGAAASAQLFQEGHAGGAAFTATRAKLLPRPWAVDDMDAALDALIAGMPASEAAAGGAAGGGAAGVGAAGTAGGPEGGATAAPGQYRRAVLFVDNAGSDVVLGMLPLARELVKGGVKVIMAANEGPTINDITAAELEPLLRQAGEADGVIGAALASGSLRVMSSGNDLPVIDLSQVSAELAAACSEGVDLVVLEGMGRAIETNLRAAFTADSLKLGMIKHPEVAQLLGGRLYDCVCKYDKGTTGNRE